MNVSMYIDTAMVLTSDNFHLIFPPPFLSRNPLVAFFKTLRWRRHYRVFRYIYFLLIEKCICNRRDISSFRVFVCEFYPEISFFGKSFAFSFHSVFIIYKVREQA